MNRKEEVQELLNSLYTISARQCFDFLSNKLRGSYPLLRLLKENKEGLSSGTLAKELNVSTARIAVALYSLECKKLVVRKKNKDDARQVIVCITNEGIKKVDKIEEEIMNYFIESLNKLNDHDLIEFKKIINKLQEEKPC